MKWLPHSLWLAAWSFWLWLGFGLYRELPRDVGPIERNLPLESGERAVTFINGTNLLVSNLQQVGTPFESRHLLNVFDAVTGERVNSVDVAKVDVWGDELCTRPGVAFTTSVRAQRGLKIVNLATGEWKALSHRNQRFGCIHSSKPLAAFIEFKTGVGGEDRLVVVNFETGKEVWVRPFIAERSAVGSPTFAPEEERLIVPARFGEFIPHGLTSSHLEVWRLEDQEWPERVIELPRGSAKIEDVAPGQIACSEIVGVGSFDVFDLDSGKTLVSETWNASYFGVGIYRDDAFLSYDGKTALGGNPAKLHELDTGRVLWTAGPLESTGPKKYGDCFSMEERWTIPFLNLSTERFTTVAYRDLNSGRLQYRHWKRDAPALFLQNSNGLYVSDQGDVRRMPLLVNYPSSPSAKRS